jgi:hypothetical protein
MVQVHSKYVRTGTGTLYRQQLPIVAVLLRYKDVHYTYQVPFDVCYCVHVSIKPWVATDRQTVGFFRIIR